MVESVLSKILYEYLLRFKYNDKKFRLESCGFIYTFEDLKWDKIYNNNET